MKAVRRGEIDYKTFCERVLDAGCAGYHVHIAGKRVVYYGRSGNSPIEYFAGSR